jgi:hypothetical protein
VELFYKKVAYFNKKKNFTWNIEHTHKSRHEIDSDSPPNDTASDSVINLLPSCLILMDFIWKQLVTEINLSPSVTANIWGRAGIIQFQKTPFSSFCRVQVGIMTGMVLLGGKLI